MRFKKVALLSILLIITLPLAVGAATRPQPLAAATDAPVTANCGSLALAHLLNTAGEAHAAAAVKALVPETAKGFSIQQLSQIADRYGFKATALWLPYSQLPALALPAIIHLNQAGPESTGHFVVLKQATTNGVLLYDPQISQTRFVRYDVFAGMWSSAVITLQKPVASLGRKMTASEAGLLFGGTNMVAGTDKGEGDLGGCPPKMPNACNDDCSPVPMAHGAPVWSVNAQNLNLYIKDTPLWITSAIGPSVRLTLSYNSEAEITGTEPFGNKWTFSYGAYLIEDATSGKVTVYMSDGRKIEFESDGAGGYIKPYKNFSTLTKMAANNFQLQFPNDQKFIFNTQSATDPQKTHLTQMQDAYGQGLTLTYSSGQLTSVTDASARSITFTYDANGLITRADGPFGRHPAFVYDVDRNLTSITDMGGFATTLDYDDDAYIAGLTDNRGRTDFYIEPSDDVTTKARYPAPGDPMQAHHRITVTYPDGKKAEYYYYGKFGYGWYVSPKDYVEYVDVNTNNYISAPKTLYYYANTAKGLREEIASINYPEGKFVGYTYDYDTGLRLSQTDSKGNTTSYAYNALGRITSITDPKGSVTTLAYAPNNYDVTTISNGLGSISLSYNSAHDVTSITDRLNQTTGFAYNTYGQITSITDALNLVTSFTYDGGNRLQQVSRAGSGLESFTYDSTDRVRTRTDATGLVLTYDYNDLNNVTQVSYPDGKSESYTYGGCCPHLITAKTDRGGRTTYYDYDSYKSLIEMVNPEGRKITYDYDANRNLIRLVDANKNATAFAYDLENRLVSKTFANGDTVRFGYDTNGLLAHKINARGIRTTFTYDQNNNLLSKIYSDLTPSATYQYDLYNRVTSMTDGTGQYQYAYDANSQLLNVDGPWGDDTIAYQYDALGRRTDVTPEDGQALTYTYDDLSRMTQVQVGSNTYAYTYAEVNPLVQSLTRPNGSITTYQYDTINRLTQIANKNSSAQVINQYVYTYNNQDQRDSETVTNGEPLAALQNEPTTYNYNAVNQLLSTTDPAQSFTYDADGNLTTGFTPARVHVYSRL